MSRRPKEGKGRADCRKEGAADRRWPELSRMLAPRRDVSESGVPSPGLVRTSTSSSLHLLSLFWSLVFFPPSPSFPPLSSSLHLRSFWTQSRQFLTGRFLSCLSCCQACCAPVDYAGRHPSPELAFWALGRDRP